MPIEASEVNRINFESKMKKMEEQLNNMNKVEVIKDPKQEIKFWLDALSNPNVTMETVKILNQCLQAELNNYLYPIVKMVIK